MLSLPLSAYSCFKENISTTQNTFFTIIMNAIIVLEHQSISGNK